MDRVIKFRAWDKDLKEFRKILNIKIVNGIPVSCVFAGSEDGNNFEKSIVAWDGATSIVLEQFTGLLDKNGTEIYEGDILDYTEWKNNTDIVAFNTKYRVEWQQLKWVLIHVSERYSVELWQQLKPEVIQNLNNDGCKAREFEVVGNIHTSTQGVETKN